MYERFTERARQVIVLAQEEARALRHNYIGTEHLLLGLVREDEGIGARVLAARGIEVEGVRTAVHRILKAGKEASPNPIPFTPRAKKTCELSLREALSLGHNYIGTEHILLGLVRENEGVGARILLDCGVDEETIRNDVIRMLSSPGSRQRRERVGPTLPHAPRSPARIGPILRVIEEYWSANPDLRLGQLILNMANAAEVDPYALEDGVLLDAIWKSWKA